MTRAILAISLLISIVSCSHNQHSISKREVASLKNHKSCPINLINYLKRTEHVRSKHHDHVVPSRPSIFKRLTVHKIRDWLRNSFKLFHDHPYDVYVLDYAPKAMGWTRKKLGTIKSIGDGDLLDDVKIGKQFYKQIETIESYETDINKLISEQTNEALKKEFFKEKIKESKRLGINGTIEFEMALLDVNKSTPSNIVQIKTSETAFDLTQLKLRRKFARRDFYKKREEIRRRALKQAIALKRIETVYQEIKRVLISHPKANDYKIIPGSIDVDIRSLLRKEAPEDSKEVIALIDRIESLFSNLEQATIKWEHVPPQRAKEKFKWIQLSEEFFTLFKKDIPQLREELNLKRKLRKAIGQENADAIENEIKELQKLKDFIKGLPESEKRALGITKFSEGLTTLQKYRWGRVATGGGALLTLIFGGELGIESIYKYIHRFRLKKEECARVEDNNAYKECVVEYIKLRFPAKTFSPKAVWETIISKDLKVKDPQILTEIKDIIKRRSAFQYGSHYQDVIFDPIVEDLIASDIHNEDYPKVLMRIKNDKDFYDKIMDPDPLRGYLRARFSDVLISDEVKEIVQVYFALGPDGNFSESARHQSARAAALKALNRHPSKRVNELGNKISEIYTERSKLMNSEGEEDFKKFLTEIRESNRKKSLEEVNK